MIKHKLIGKGSIAHALISPINDPNKFIPVKIVIKDVRFDEYNPLYLVKVIKFYDSIYFLKKYFMNNKFSNEIGKKARTFWISDDIKTTEQLQNYLEKEGARFYLVVDSIHTTRYKNDMTDMFNKIQDFLIDRNIQELQELSTRNSYSGYLKFSSKVEFFIRLKKMISDKIVDIKMTWDEFIKRF